MSRKRRSEVAIIVLNWNGWQDTLECLDSIFRYFLPKLSNIHC